MKIQAVIFDLDGTLIDSMGVWEKIDVEFLTKRGFTVPPDYISKISAYSFQEAAEYTIERFHLPETVDALIQEWNERARFEYTNNIFLKPYAKDYIMSLKSANVKLAIATSLPCELYEPALENNGILDYFDVICSVDEVKRGKEFPDIFLYTAEKLKVRSEHCLVFEDVLQAVKSAKLAGMSVYGVYDDSSKAHWDEIKCIADGHVYDFHNAPMPE